MSWKGSILARVEKLEQWMDSPNNEEPSRRIFNRLGKLEEEVFGDIQDADPSDDSVLEEDAVIKPGWVIVSPNPPRCKGTDHYYVDDLDCEDDDTDGLQWSSDLQNATRYPTKTKAQQKCRLLNAQGDVHHSLKVKTKCFVQNSRELE